MVKNKKKLRNHFIHGDQVDTKIKILSNYLEKIYLKEIDVFYYQKIDQNG